MTTTPEISHEPFERVGTGPTDIGEALREYVSNPLFRSARADELVIKDNPYRRPVRPEDFEWLSLGKPVTRENAAQLSSLLGNRVLLNIYDAHRWLAPARLDDEHWRDFELFFSAENRMRGDRIRPFLEHHLLDYVHRSVDEFDLAAIADRPGGTGDFLARLAADCERRAAELAALISGAEDPRRHALTVAIQLLGCAFAAPSAPTSTVLRAFVGPEVSAGPEAEETHRALEEVLRLNGLSRMPHAYYQFYLPSTLSLMNYLSAERCKPGHALVLVGAMCARALSSVALLVEHGPALKAAAGGVDTGDAAVGATGRATSWLVDQVAGAVTERYGKRGLLAFCRGAAEYAVLLDVHHDDVSAQLRWMNAPEAYRRKAERLHEAITMHGVAVDLDTFVESWEECSTTHVHDEDRLIVIESGEMEFWNHLGGTQTFRPGDAFFVPRHRLHGSVVRSGRCVYHQPVITPEIDQRFG